MFLVFLLFLLFFIILASNIRINIEYLKLTNDLKIRFNVKIGLFIFNKIKLFEIKINEKSKILNKINTKGFKNVKIKYNLKNIKKIKFNIDKFYLNISIGTIDAAITPNIIVLISTVISIILTKFYKYINKGNCYYNLIPVYINKNIINLYFSGIIKIKLIHIIYMIFIFTKKGSGKSERTSNRRTYGYSYE